MARCFSLDIIAKLRPVMLRPVTSSSASKTPIWRQMASAVSLLSPVMTTTCTNVQGLRGSIGEWVVHGARETGLRRAGACALGHRPVGQPGADWAACKRGVQAQARLGGQGPRTLMPARVHSSMASLTSGRGGSSSAAMPRKTQSLSMEA